MSTSLRDWLVEVRTLIESAGLKLAPAPFTATVVTQQLTDMSFSLDVQSQNTGKYRDDDFLVRAKHRLKVSIVKKVRPLDQFESILMAADIEAGLHEKMLPRSALPDTVVTWIDTKRTLTSNREHMILEMSYDCDVDFRTGATPQE